MKHWILFVTLMILVACGETETSEESDANIELEKQESNAAMVAYNSDIRPDLDSLDVAAVYRDTLTYHHFDDNYDYWYAYFQTKDKKTVAMAYDEIISEYAEGSVFVVEWQLDTFYEAGEGDAMYYRERMLSFEVIEEVKSFQSWMYDGFIDDLMKNDQSLLEKYVHPRQEVVLRAFNPGVFCALSSNGDVPEFTVDWGDGYSVLAKEPDGDFCEGYPNATNGFYYFDISKSDIPVYPDITTMNQEKMSEERPELPIDNVDRIIKVMVIVDEYLHSRFYFFQSEGQYYMWFQDYCDCSA